MNARNSSFKPTKIALMAMVVTIMATGLWVATPAPNAQAGVMNTYSDQRLTEKVPGEGAYVSGDHMVWYEEDANGHQNIFYKNMKSGVTKQITDFPSIKDNPLVTVTNAGQAVVIWIDKRYVGGGSGMWDVMAQFVDTGEELKLSSTVAPHVNVHVSGSIVTWNETWKRNMFFYDLDKRQETAVGVGTDPHTADGKIAYITGEGDIAVYTISTGQTEVLVDLPYHLFPTELTYNGTHILWKESDMDWRTKYVMLDTTDSSALPVDLTPQTYKEKEYPNLYLGDQQAAWVEWKNGIQQLTGVSLVDKETHAIATGEYVVRTMGFQGDQLLLQGADGSLVYRPFDRTEAATGQAPAGTTATNSVTGKFGSEGGVLTVTSGGASLVIPKGAFLQETEVTLKENTSADLPNVIPHALGEKQTVSPAWHVEFDGKLAANQTLELVIAMDDLRYTTDQKQKASIYRFSVKENDWDRVGGNTATVNGVSAEIRESGAFAIFMNHVSFTDITKHWAKDEIEILASKEIINGMSGSRFEPEADLTRAQFTKMLLGAMGITPKENVSGVFRDVAASHWSAGWVEAAAELRLVQGADGKFKPDDKLTREQMVVMLIRALGEEKAALEFNESVAFEDADTISSWAYGYAALASEIGLVQGSGGLFLPKNDSNRAQAASVIYRLMYITKTL